MDKNFNKSLEVSRCAVTRPSWESRNEGVHERVNFDDTIWGFSLAGGSYYKTPLRVTEVKEASRAERAGVKVGDVLKSINNHDTSQLTIQEAHDIILASGCEILLNVVAPDVDETTYSVYQDELEDESTTTNRLYEEVKQQGPVLYLKIKKCEEGIFRWPCNKKRDVLYRESNCYLVPSRYEANHPQAMLKNDSDQIARQSVIVEFTYI